MDNNWHLTAKPGDRVVYTGEGGYDWDKVNADRVLVVGHIYTIRQVIIHSYLTEIYLYERIGAFNSVMFKLANGMDRAIEKAAQ